MREVSEAFSDKIPFNRLELEIFENDRYEFNMNGTMPENKRRTHKRFQNGNSAQYPRNTHAEKLPIERKRGDIHRAGIIPWKKEGDDVWFIFGLDAISGDITDFGGTHEYIKDNNLIETAIREYREEVYNAPDIKYSDVYKSMGIMNKPAKTFEIFPEYRSKWPQMYSTFLKERSKDDKFEVIDILILNKKQLMIMLGNGESNSKFSFYTKIYHVLSKHKDVIKNISNRNVSTKKRYKNRGNWDNRRPRRWEKSR
jgi:hypothetical protein